MMKVKINLSDKQQQRLRNGHSVRATPKMAGSGASVIIDPMTFNNLNKHLERNKGMLVSLSPELIKENMSGTGEIITNDRSILGRIFEKIIYVFRK